MSNSKTAGAVATDMPYSETTELKDNTFKLKTFPSSIPAMINALEIQRDSDGAM